MLTRAQLLVAVACGAAALTTSSAVSGQATGSAGSEWSGTVTVTRRAAGSIQSDEGKASLGFRGSETLTFQLGPDGVASYQATHTSNVDYSGQYSVPTVGTGTGTTYYGVGFNGSNWEVAIDGGDDFATEVDHSTEDHWWASQFQHLITLADKVTGTGPTPLSSRRVEKGARGVNGVAFAARGGANAKTLTGTHTEQLPSSGPEGLDGPPIPMTLTVSWHLTLDPVQPKVAIHGPDCGCLDAADPESTPLKFRAGTTVGGGRFSEFEVISDDGQKPAIVSNEGGERPELVLTATQKTGAVTLKIHYTRNGKRYDALPRRVEFCTLDAIQLKDDEHDLAFDAGGALVVNARTRAWHNGDEVSEEVAWELEKMGSPTKLSADPPDAKAETITFTFDGLPERNDSFGRKVLTARISRNRCSCHARESVRTFFVPGDRTHPGDNTPNWFYYWLQTDAVSAPARAALNYQEIILDPNLPTVYPIAKYDPETQTLILSRSVHVKDGCRDEVDRATHVPTGRQAEGVDCFAETVRHEWQHRQDAVAWWGSPAGPYGVSLVEWFARDWDHDMVPNEVEDRESGCAYGSAPALTPSGGRQTWFTCSNRPFPDATDAEINAYWVGWTWPVGSVNASDWSCGPLAKQWRGRTCGR